MKELKLKLEKKVIEHRQEIVQAQNALEELQKDFSTKPPKLEEMGKIKILMDKVLFHQGAMKALEDFKGELC